MYKLSNRVVLKKFGEEIIIFDKKTQRKRVFNSSFSLILEKILSFDNYNKEILKCVNLDSKNVDEIKHDIDDAIKYLLEESIIEKANGIE